MARRRQRGGGGSGHLRHAPLMLQARLLGAHGGPRLPCRCCAVRSASPAGCVGVVATRGTNADLCTSDAAVTLCRGHGRGRGRHRDAGGRRGGGGDRGHAGGRRGGGGCTHMHAPRASTCGSRRRACATDTLGRGGRLLAPEAHEVAACTAFGAPRTCCIIRSGTQLWRRDVRRRQRTCTT